jgi:hypothetical protein
MYTTSMMRRALYLLTILLLVAGSIACGGGSGPTWPPNNNTGHPSEYDLLFPTKTARWDSTAFPIRVYITAPPNSGSATSTLIAAAQNALKTWNGQVNGIPAFFVSTDDPKGYDVIVRWQDDTPDAYTVAVDRDDHIAIHKIAMSQSLIDPDQVRPLLSHELGHVLGLGHSGIRGDLMFPIIEPGLTKLTLRDYDMINWLYNQTNYIPIRTY